MEASTAIITQPALGQDVQLGMLYDVRTGQFFSGISPWNNEVVNAKQELDEQSVQNAEFTYAFSLEEARKQAGLNVEGGLGLDLGMIKATGSAKYLNDNTMNLFEARLDVSCTIIRRTRRIPQEILASMQHERKLEDLQFTHFVGEVVEGANATLSFVQSCSSSDHARTILGALKAGILQLPLDIGGQAGLMNTNHSTSNIEDVKNILQWRNNRKRNQHR